MFKEFLSFALNKAEPLVEDHVLKIFDAQYRDKRVIKKARGFLQDKYGNETFYNDLDLYITSNHVLELLIPSIRGESKVQPHTVQAFKLENAEKFLKYNPNIKQNKVIASRIPDIFEEIFNIIYSAVLSLNPHTNYGKLQRDLHIGIDMLSDEHRGMNAKLDDLQKDLSSVYTALSSGGIVAVATESINGSSAEIDQFTREIKEIESTYQSKCQYNTALSRYYSLLANIATTLAGQTQEQINVLICSLNCNIALCLSNLGQYQKARESLNAIPKETASKNKVYHVVVALVYIQKNDIENYAVALEHAETALELDPDYHNAFSVRQFLRCHIYPDEFEKTLGEMDEHYRAMIEEGTERDKIEGYYQFRGLINLCAEHYPQAVEDFQHAIEYGYNPVIADLNIAVVMYAEASRLVSKDSRHLCPPIDQKIMMKAADLLKQVIDSLAGTVDHVDVRKRAVSVYVSACATLGKKHGLSPISEYMCEGLEYEHLRSLLLGASEKLTEAQLLLLSPEDRLFVTVGKLLEDSDMSACKAYISNLVDSGEETISAPVLHILLQACLSTKTPADYWKYRDMAIEYGINGELLDSMDACAYELGGELLQAKDIFVRIAKTSVNSNILENTLRFFARNHCTSEARTLFLRMHDLIASDAIYEEDVDGFYRKAVGFFVERKDDVVEKILSELPAHLLSEGCKSELYASFYSASNDCGGLYECLDALSCASGEFRNAYGMALCAVRLFRYDEALKICFDLEKKSLGAEESVQLYWLISDILILMDNYDDSYFWAKKAHELTRQNPYERSHQAFFARAFRCNHQEALGEIIEYQKEHPVVVDWIKSFSIAEDDTDIVTSLKDAINAFDPSHKDYEDHEKLIAELYKKGTLPIATVLQQYNNAFWRLFDFAKKNKFRISFGDNKTLFEDVKSIKNSIVIDALTLVVLAYHKCLDVLDQFKCVYVNYGSVETIQQAYIAEAYSFLDELLEWFKKCDNIIFEADGFIEKEDDIIKIFTSDFIACCNIAIQHGEAFLYCDAIVRKIQRELSRFQNVKFVSLPAVCYKMLGMDPVRQSDVLYELMNTCTFVPFRGETILNQIRKNNYVVSENLMEPFMCCNTDCDMDSFSNVYLVAIEELQKENHNAACVLVGIVLRDALKIWRRGAYYRELSESYANRQAQLRAQAISKYVATILSGTEEIFTKIEDSFQDAFEDLSSATGYAKTE